MAEQDTQVQCLARKRLLLFLVIRDCWIRQDRPYRRYRRRATILPGSQTRSGMLFFLIQNGIAKSLRAATILRCLIRQCLTVNTIPKDVEDRLQHCFENSSPDTDDLLSLMKSLCRKSLINSVVLDGFDECPSPERDVVLAIFRSLMRSTGSVIKFFVSSRQEVDREMDRNFVPYYQISMSCTEVTTDIANYIRFSIEEKLARQELCVDDLNLIAEIGNALIERAQGMSVGQISLSVTSRLYEYNEFVHVSSLCLTSVWSFVFERTLSRII